MSKIMKRSLRVGLIAAGAAMGLVAGGMLHNRAARAAGDGPPPGKGPTADQAAEEVHGMFQELTQELKITDAEKPKMTEIEDNAVARVKADPMMLMDKEFQKSVMTDIRAVLSPEQQKQIDHMLAEEKMARTGSSLHQLGLAMLLYENDNSQATPPDLGALVAEKLDPATFLTYESATKTPDDWAKMDDKAKAEWINKNSDFVYVGGGKKSADEAANFVVAYIKPDASPDGSNAFLMGDGSVQQRPADVSKAIIEEVKAGKNPPPSYKEQAFVPPPPPHQ
jgi:hypothetical protein